MTFQWSDLSQYLSIYYGLWSPFKLIPLKFAQTILIAERIERCTGEKVFKEKGRNAFCLKCGFLMFNT